MPGPKELIRLGADTLLRDSQKNTPADTAKQYRKQGLYEILKWAARRQANGAAIPVGGLLGENAKPDARPSCFETMLNCSVEAAKRVCEPIPGVRPGKVFTGSYAAKVVEWSAARGRRRHAQG